MTDKKLIILLYAFRYAVDRIPTMALKDIEDELIDNLPKFPDWVLEQMQGDIERNFRMMKYQKAKDRAVEDLHNAVYGLRRAERNRAIKNENNWGE